MSFSILLPALSYPTPSPMDGISSAIGFASTLGGRLTVVAHAVDIAPITNPLAVGLYDYGGIAAAIEADSKTMANSIATHARQIADQLQLPVNIEHVRSRPELAAGHMAEAARPHDLALAVLSKDSNTLRDVAEAMLFGSGGPVVLFPQQPTTTRIETVAIAWDGGRAAARAIRDALPILRLSRRAIVLTAHDDKALGDSRVGTLSELLRLHEIDVSLAEVASAGRAIGDALQGAALAHAADLLVMGAYGHTRLREFVLGGATRNVLADPRLPVLMSH